MSRKFTIRTRLIFTCLRWTLYRLPCRLIQEPAPAPPSPPRYFTSGAPSHSAGGTSPVSRPLSEVINSPSPFRLHVLGLLLSSWSSLPCLSQGPRDFLAFPFPSHLHPPSLFPLLPPSPPPFQLGRSGAHHSLSQPHRYFRFWTTTRISLALSSPLLSRVDNLASPPTRPQYMFIFSSSFSALKRSRPFSRRGARFLSLFYNSPPPFFPLTFSLPICLFGPRLRASSRIHSTLGGILSLFSPSPRVSFLHATRRNSLRLALSGCRVLA